MDAHVEASKSDQQSEHNCYEKPDTVIQPEMSLGLVFFGVEEVEEDEEVESCREDRVATRVAILGRASDRLDFLTVHVGSRFMVSQLSQVHDPQARGQEQHIVKGPWPVFPIKDKNVDHKVWDAIAPYR